MLELIGLIIAIWFIRGVVVGLTPKKVHLKNLAQYAKDEYEKLEKEYLVNIMPIFHNLSFLISYYELGGKKLDNIVLKRFFSYPQLLEINKNDEFIINNVVIGKCSKLDIYSHIINQIKSNNNKMIVEEASFGFNFTTLYGKNIEWVYDRVHADGAKTQINENLKYHNRVLNNSINNFNNNKELVFSYLPKEYKELYDDLYKNNYSIEVMKDKYNTLFKKINEEYSEYLKKENLKNKIVDVCSSSNIKKCYYIHNNIGGDVKNGYNSEIIDKESFLKTGLLDKDAMDTSKEACENYIKEFNLK